MKRLLMIVLGVCMVLTIYAQNIEVNCIDYEYISSKEVEVHNLSYRFSSSSLVVPAEITIDGYNYKVTSIGEKAFMFGKFISVELPSTIKNIGAGAFGFCKNLTNIVIPNSVVSIGNEAFVFCENLTNIVIPNSVVSIGNEAFGYCENLTNIVIPNSVKHIGDEIFSGCSKLRSVTLPDNSFYTDFRYCSRLESVKGHTVPYFYRLKLGELNHLSPIYHHVDLSFSHWAYDRIVDTITKWQEKREFETTQQWRSRVTESSRNEYLRKLKLELKNEFLEKKKVIYNKELYDYDPVYEVFEIRSSSVRPFYLKVPANDVEYVKKKWDKAKLNPTLDIVNDELTVVDCLVKVGKKTFKGVPIAPEENTEDFALQLPPLDLNLGNNEIENAVTIVVDNSIDREIPVNPIRNQKTFALIIGNENYQHVSNVSYVLNDANTFAEYCHKTLGIPKKNIRSYKDATLGVMMSALKDIKSIAKAYKGDIRVIFYYAGHGIPGDRGEKAYLLPVDMDGSQPELCLSTEYLYKELSSLDVRSTIVFMDACFSGAQRGEGMLASARAVALKVKQVVPQGNCVVFSAASNEQAAFPYMEKGHGMFTYFLLKKLQESKGNVTLGELGEYICENVVRQSVVVNRREQTPTIISSTLFSDKWKSIKLK